MPYFNVHIGDDELLEDVSDSALLNELKSRDLSLGIQTGKLEKRQTLTESSDFLRKSGQIALAARLDELMLELEV